MCFIFFIFLEEWKKTIKNPMYFSFSVKSNIDNSKATTKSSSIKSSKLDEILDFSLSFTLIMIIAFKT